MLQFLPLVVVVAIAGVLVGAAFSERLDAWLTRIAFLAFGGRELAHSLERERLLGSAAMGVPYREYATKTRLYAVGIGIGGGVLGIYLGVGIVAAADAVGVGSGTDVSPFAPATYGGIEIAVVLLASVVSGAVGGMGTLVARWRIPSMRADARQREIDAGLPRMVAFTYALTRGGMSFPDVLRTVADNEDIFGEGAAEVGTAVRNIDLFNVDLVTAVQELSDETPSEQFGVFTENLSSVLQSGGNISTFLNEQYERYRDEAEEQQAEILNVLATTAEMYVTLVVAGMLFLVTILLIIGLTAGDTLFVLRVLTYAIIPAVNVLFLAYLVEITQPLRASGGSETRSKAGTTGTVPESGVETDGGYTRPESAANHERLFAYRQLQSVRETLTSPIQSLVDRPELLLYVTVPIAVGMVAYRLPAVLSGGVDVRALDDLLVQTAIFLMGTFAVVYEYSKRRLRRLESAVPDLLERLASLNESGISVVSSFDRVRRSDVGALDAEVDRIWRDMKWGATVEEALGRFESRVKTVSVTRVVALITNAMQASNEIGPVLRIAAEQARSDLRLRRQRRQEMFTYLVVVYVSFLVFLIVVAALEQVLIPSLPDPGAFSNGGNRAVPGIIEGIESDRRALYQLVFFHTALVQATLSGLVAGVMGSSSIKDGMKHATVMLSITYLVLTVLV
jgi:flagellar protein FlaJ